MYWEFVKKSFSQQFVYRANTLFSILRSFVYLFITVSIWTALYQNKEVIDNVSYKEMLTYVFMVEIVRTIVTLNISGYIAGRTSSGIISIDFIRPASIPLCAFSDSFGYALARLLLFSFPLTILGSIIWGFVFPAHWYQWLLFFPALALAVILYSLMSYIMGLTAFWTKTDYHIRWVIGSLMTLFSGSYIPLWFYPTPLRMIANFLPFKYFIFEPLNIFMGKTTLQEALFIILMQLIWVVALFVISKLVWRLAQKVVTVQGG